MATGRIGYVSPEILAKARGVAAPAPRRAAAPAPRRGLLAAAGVTGTTARRGGFQRTTAPRPAAVAPPRAAPAPRPYSRFDYKTPGAALKHAGMDEATAARRAIDLLGVTRVQPQEISAAVQDAIGRGTFQLGPGITDPAVAAVMSRANTNVNDLRARDFLIQNGLTAQSSPAQLAAGIDAYWRSQQAENQKPKRGLGAAFKKYAIPALAGIVAPALVGASGLMGAAASFGGSSAANMALGNNISPRGLLSASRFVLT